MKIMPRHKIGDRIQMTADAIANYGTQYAGQTFTITSVATAYMPAAQFYAQGRPAGYHPGFDSSTGCALYDCANLNMSLYEWEIK